MMDERHRAALGACLQHARDLLESARAVYASGRPHIAYHLATLSLEELGRRELLKIQRMAERKSVPPAWPQKHTQDHVQKLFWGFFGAGFSLKTASRESFEDMRRLAAQIHSRRIEGLYVNQTSDGLSIPV